MSNPISARGFKRGLSYLIVGGWSLFSVFFVVWVILASLKRIRELFGSPLSIPADPQWGNFVKTWVNNRFGDYFLNSLLVTSASVVAILIVAVPAGYVLSRGRFRGRQALSSFFAFGMGVPFPLLFVPLFVMMASMRLADTLTGLTLVYVALSIPLTIYVLEGFFSSLPSEL